ncbi:MAG: pyrroline-5-carboxylate reductase dimerization domain-containing protein, partial [Miltoncostaeaceae bacterium]
FPVATAIAGSGPGFIAYVAAALERGGVAGGLGTGEARAIVQGVLAGTAALLEGGGDPTRLQGRVTSPGGTTAAGVAVLEDGGVGSALAAAVAAAAERAAEL